MLFIVGAILTRMFVIAKEINVKRHEVFVKNDQQQNQELSLFFISDVHRRKLTPRLLKKVKERIDAVIIGGDFAEQNVPLSRIEHNLKQLNRLAPVYFVWGNNDREVNEQAMRELFEKYEVRLLENEHQSLTADFTWGICGTEDPSVKKVDIDKATAGIEVYNHVLFVSHQPRVWKLAEQVFQPTILLAGHTHGGQIRLGKFGIDELGSFTNDDGIVKLISNGYGTTKLPFRFGAHPECHVIQIKKSEGEKDYD